ncbi:MAG: tetratricopeptide repeat protein [Thiolinea sp.]
MIKITVNYTRRNNLMLMLVSTLGISACAPIPIPMPQFPGQVPQAYPIQPGVQRQQPARVIPQAGALPNTQPRVQNAQNPRVVVQQQPRQVAAPRRQPAQVYVPPTLKPAQQQARRNTQQANAARYTSRPSASVSRAPAVVYREKQKPVTRTQNRPSVTTTSRSSSAQTSAKPGISGSLTPSNKAAAPTVRPAPRPSASVKKQQPETAQTQTADNTQAKEVLDLSQNSQKPVASVQPEQKPAPVPPMRSYNSSPAVTVLIKQANNALTAGKADRAAATLERALRIAPEDPRLWLRLAEVNAQQGNKAQAASMARKAMNLSPDDAGLQARGQRLIN